MTINLLEPPPGDAGGLKRRHLRKAVGGGATIRDDRSLDREIRYFPGLPYDSWHEAEMDLESRSSRLLTAEEEQMLFRQMNLAYFRATQRRDAILAGNRDAGDLEDFRRLVGRADLIREKLMQSFYKLNLSIAGRFANSHNQFDDLASEGQMTMLRAISRFDPERGFRFSTYAMHAIRRRLLRFVRRQQKERQSIQTWTDESPSIDPGRWTLAYEQRVTTAMAAVERLLHQLSPRERYVVRSRFGWGQEFEPRTLREIAAELGVSRERVRQLEERALRKLRSLAVDLGIEA